MSSAWRVAGGELANVLEDRPADRLGGAGGLGKALQETAVVAGVVKLLAGAPGVGDAVGIDHDDVAGLESNLRSARSAIRE